MSFKYTDEQELIFKTVAEAVTAAKQEKPAPTLIKINAVAGSSKSTSLIEAIRRVHAIDKTVKSRYLVFNAALAEEARTAYGHTAITSTLHKLAYGHTVRQYKLNPSIAQFLTWQDLPATIKPPFGTTNDVLAVVEDFCTSGSLDIIEYIKSAPDTLPETFRNPRVVTAAVKVIDAMATGKMRCTHSFYLKLFHILLVNGEIDLPPMDVLVIDECQDLTQITLDVVDRYPAKLKILVGDPLQAIYGWMGCVSAFEYYEGQGITLHLSKSFRCNTHIAGAIQHFCRTTFDQTVVFEGVDYQGTPQMNTHAYLARTNASLIEKMIELNATNTPYRLATKQKAKQMFELPLAIIYAKPEGKQHKPELKIIQEAVNKWGKTDRKKSKLEFIAEYTEEHPTIAAAISIIGRYKSDTIIETATIAESHIRSNSNYILSSIHTSKGLTYDEVTMAPDVNKAISKIMDQLTHPSYTLTKEDKAELYLYYVSASRARHRINGAHYLTKYIQPIN